MSNENIRIALRQHRLYLFQGEVPLKSFPVAIGKPATPTPVGQYAVFEKTINPGGILGSRWMGFYLVSDGVYGIHGTNAPQFIGHSVSLGCVRMNNADIEAIFPLIPLGSKITIAEHIPNQLSSNYTVQAGDTLWKIAKKTGVDLAVLAQLNNLTAPDLLHPGQTLLIPAGA